MSEQVALVVEDDENLALIFAESMRQAGFTTEIFRRGDKALQRLGEIVPFVVLLDLNLPGVPGEALLYYIRRQARLEKVHVIIVSADFTRADLLQDKVDMVLIKPISFIQLRDLSSRLKNS